MKIMRAREMWVTFVTIMTLSHPSAAASRLTMSASPAVVKGSGIRQRVTEPSGPSAASGAQASMLMAESMP